MRNPMTFRTRVGVGSLLILMSLTMTSAQQTPYQAQQTGAVVQLRDVRSQTTVSLLPSVGNVAFEMSVKGHNVLNFSGANANPEQFTGGLTGIPFMGPWANRLDEQAFAW